MKKIDRLCLVLIAISAAGLFACGGGQAPATPPSAGDAPSPAPAGQVMAGAAPARASSAPSFELRQVAYIKASNAGAGDQFGVGGTLLGNGVALSNDGSTLAVGASFESSGAVGIHGDQSDDSVYGAGAVYVFTRNGETWAQQAYVKASNPGLTDNFGYAVALSEDGDTMVVSAYFEASAATGVNANQDDDSIPQAGAVYVFTRDDETWSQQAYLKASNTGEAAVGDELGDGDQFGFAIALSEDGGRLAVSAIAEDSGAAGMDGDQSDNSAVSAGAVYLFERDGDSWTQRSYLKPSNPSAGDLFGYSLAFTADGDTLVVGSFDEDGSVSSTSEEPNDEASGTGAAYVFEHEQGTWSQTAYLKASNAERNDSYGVTVAISDDGSTLAITSLDEDSMTTGINSTAADDYESDTSTGAVYVLVNDGSGWTEQAYIKASNTGVNDWFGSRIALSGDGDTLVGSAQLEDSAAQGIGGDQADDSAEEAGAVYLLRRSGETWTQEAYIKGSNTGAYDEFGSSMAVSRDGSLIAIGARGEDSAAKGIGGDQTDNTAYESGAVYIFTR